MTEESPRPGRRAAPKRSVTRPQLPSVRGAGAIVVLVLAVLLVLVTPSTPGRVHRPGEALSAQINLTTLGCPGLPSKPDGVTTRYGAGRPDLPGLGSDGTASADATGGALLGLGQGRTAEVPATTAEGPVVRGVGDLAVGLFAWRADIGSTKAVADCPGPRASWWFTGAGSDLSHESTLTLSNLDPGPAVVDLRIISPDGDLDVSDTGGRAINIPGGSSTSMSLVGVAAQSKELAVWVHASRGRVVAGISDTFAGKPGDPVGQEWMPSAVAPARTLRLAGLPSQGGRTLVIGNPSAQEAVVDIELAGPQGRFVPAGLGAASVPPGEVATVDLSKALKGEPAAVRLTSTFPVVASVRSVASGDLAYAGPVLPLSGPAALPVIEVSSVELSAGAELSRARVTAFNADGKARGSKQVSLAANSTQLWRVPQGSAYVVVVPSKGRVYGAIVYSGTGLAAAPLRDLPISVQVPRVIPFF